MSKVIGKIKRKPNAFYYVTASGNVVERSRTSMQKKRKKAKK